MAYDCFQDFLRRLEREDELRRITESVSPHLEITEVADRMMKSPGGGKALVFDHPTGHDVPVAINTMGSRKRMSLALGVPDYEEIACEIEELLKPEVPAGFVDKLKMLPKLGRLAACPPKTVANGICQEVVQTSGDVDLTRLPVLHCWPQDGGPFITLPLVFTYDPQTGKRGLPPLSRLYRRAWIGPHMEDVTMWSGLDEAVRMLGPIAGWSVRMGSETKTTASTWTQGQNPYGALGRPAGYQLWQGMPRHFHPEMGRPIPVPGNRPAHVARRAVVLLSARRFPLRPVGVVGISRLQSNCQGRCNHAPTLGTVVPLLSQGRRGRFIVVSRERPPTAGELHPENDPSHHPLR